MLVCTNFKLHKYLIISGLFLLMLYGGYVTYVFLFSDNDIGNTLQLSSFLIQSGMLFFMLLGFQFAKKNIKSSVLQEVIGKNMRKIHVINILFLLLIILLFVVSILCSYLIYFHLNSSLTTTFATETFLFLSHYWVLPFWIMGIIGYTFGMNSNSKLIYVFLIFIWVIVSPTNLYYFNDFLSTAQIKNSVKWLENLNLGVYDLSLPYDAFYSFEYNWTKRFLLFFTILFLWLISLFVASNRKLQLLNLITVVIVFFSFSLYPNGYMKNEIDDLNRLFEDYDYYDNQKNVAKVSEDLFDYDINRVDLSVNNVDEFNVEATLNILYKNKTRIAFTLYQGFSVSNVTLENEVNVFFKQEGDYLIVSLPKHIQDRNDINLQITYSGKGSNYRPATPEYIYLPADFGWVPNNNFSPTHFMFNDGDILPSSSKLSSKANYTLTYKGKGKLDYINLPQKSDSVFEGKATGVTLILGNITASVVNGQVVHYPKAWFLYEKEIEEYLDTFTRSLQKYNEIFNKNYKLPKSILLLPNMDMNNNYNYINSSGDEEHIILQINPVSLTKVVDLYDVIPFQIERAFSDSDNSFKNSKRYAAWFVYNNFLGSYMLSNKDLGISDSKSLKDFHLYLVESSCDLHDKSFYEQLHEIDLKALSDYFFIEWKKTLLDENNNDWLQLEQLLNQYL